MSRSAFGNCDYKTKRSRFGLWSIAIASSLMSTGLVYFRPASTWAQEETTTENAQVQPSQRSQGSGTEPNGENELAKQFDNTAFKEMLRKGQFDQAAEIIDGLLADDPTDMNALSMSTLLARLMVSSNPSAAESRLSEAVEHLLALESLNPKEASLLANAADYIVQFRASAPLAERVGVVDRILDRLKAESKSELASSIKSLVTRKARLLMQGGQQADAKAMLDELAQSQLKSVDVTDGRSVMELVRFAGIYNSVLSSEFLDASKELHNEIEAIAMKALDKPEPAVSDFTPFYTLKAAEIRSLGYSNPTAGEAVLEELESRFEKLQEQLGESDDKELQLLVKNMKGLRSALEQSLKRERLIGSDAIEIDAEHVIGMEPTTMAALQGKVVLIDFWAVWCGPCIATFPHLIEWHEEFSDSGLVILGATRFYGYEWDDEKERVAQGKDVTAESELAMLEKFRESHKLHHAFFVSPKTSTYSKDFGVTGIPQAVLIDKQGKIRMIRVGSGDANAKAMHTKIIELLAELHGNGNAVR
jgi:thiol-disulfide isomerase/thioredoxin